MSKRITIMIWDDLYDDLRKIQGQIIKTSKDGISFSNVLNMAAEKGLPELRKWVRK